MIKNILPATLTLSILLLIGCKPGEPGGPAAPETESTATAAEGSVVANVNGQAITEETLKMFLESNRRANIPREKLVEDLVKQELLYQEALRKNLESKPEVAGRLRFLKRWILSQAAMEDFISNTAVSDAEIQKEYEENFGAQGQEEYKARHILTKTEDKANEVIQKLAEGGDFAKLAVEFSTGPTGPKGGDLGWFSPQQMVAPFSEAVVALKNGDYTRTPVQTQFGWHVILREDSRAKTPPPLDSMKANIQAQLQRKAIESYIENLKSTAKIEIIPPKPAEPVKPAAEMDKAAAPAESAATAEEPITAEAEPESSEPATDDTSPATE